MFAQISGLWCTVQKWHDFDTISVTPQSTHKVWALVCIVGLNRQQQIYRQSSISISISLQIEGSPWTALFLHIYTGIQYTVGKVNLKSSKSANFLKGVGQQNKTLNIYFFCHVEARTTGSRKIKLQFSPKQQKAKVTFNWANILLCTTCTTCTTSSNQIFFFLNNPSDFQGC